MVKPSRMVVDRRIRKHMKEHRPDITIVDLSNHVMGRAATVIAKQLLLGRKITVVQCDRLNLAGPCIRNKIHYLNFLKKLKRSNPKKGPFHHRAPNEIFTRVVRSMLPRYTKRGQQALRRLVTYDGIPINVAGKGGRVVIPKALRYNCLKGTRPYTILGEMCHDIGWKYKAVVDKLEKARVESAARHHKSLDPVRAAWKKAGEEAMKKINKNNKAILEKFGCA